jgi:hypothetical protein
MAVGLKDGGDIPAYGNFHVEYRPAPAYQLSIQRTVHRNVNSKAGLFCYRIHRDATGGGDSDKNLCEYPGDRCR